MALRYSDAFGVTVKDFEKEGAFNGFIDIDSPFHIDPYLLHDVKCQELQGAYQSFRNYFEEIIHLLEVSSNSHDALYRAAVRKLVFKELPNVCLGYSKSGSSGSGIGPKLARNITKTASEIIKGGIHDPVVFELVGLLEDGIGADRVSDMTIRIILPHLMSFSHRVAKNLNLRTHDYKYHQVLYHLPYDPNKNSYIILVPNEILRDLPMAYDWDDIDYVCRYNKQLRLIVNKIVGNTWKQATSRIPKYELKDAILRYPGLLEDLISQYKSKVPDHYDFTNDPQGLLNWHDTAKEFADKYPLELILDKHPTSQNILDLVQTICLHFRKLVENNGLNSLFYDDHNKLRHEKYAQLLFYGIADSYCSANNLDINREPNAGRGPVDFKFSHGYNLKVTVEVKYSSNNNLVKGFTTQLPIYNAADQTNSSIYLIIRTTLSTIKIKRVINLRQESLKQGIRVPEIILVDGRLHPSASRV
jgi:hypothetical protein